MAACAGLLLGPTLVGALRLSKYNSAGEILPMATTDVLFNPFLPEFHADPYPAYRRLRELDPVHHTPLGLWVLTRYDDVLMALRDARFGREGFAPLLEAAYG